MIQDQLASLIHDAITAAQRDGGLPPFDPPPAAVIPIERPKLDEHGDFATPIAMKLAQPARRAPRQIAEAIAALDSVSEVFSVTGTYDLIAMVRVAKHDDLADVIPGRISKIPGVEGTDTHVAFRTYSQHDLEAAFDIGLDA